MPALGNAKASRLRSKRARMYLNCGTKSGNANQYENSQFWVKNDVAHHNRGAGLLTSPAQFVIVSNAAMQRRRRVIGNRAESAAILVRLLSPRLLPILYGGPNVQIENPLVKHVTRGGL